MSLICLFCTEINPHWLSHSERLPLCLNLQKHTGVSCVFGTFRWAWKKEKQPCQSRGALLYGSGPPASIIISSRAHSQHQLRLKNKKQKQKSTQRLSSAKHGAPRWGRDWPGFAVLSCPLCEGHFPAHDCPINQLPALRGRLLVPVKTSDGSGLMLTECRALSSSSSSLPDKTYRTRFRNGVAGEWEDIISGDLTTVTVKGP